MVDEKMFLAMLFLACGLLFLVFGFWSAENEGTTEDVPCYDEYRNKIKGIVCEDIVFAYGPLESIFIFAGFVFLIVFFIWILRT